MNLNLFIVGPSGSGKSTQAKLVADKYNLVHISMGQLLRDEIASGTRFGLGAKKAVDNGTAVSDEIALPVLIAKLKQVNNANFVVDGFPRLIQQGRYIDNYLHNLNSQTSLLIHIVINFLEIVKRRQQAGEKFQDSNRTDNTPQAIANRQKILYRQNIDPILKYYRHIDKLCEIDGNRPIRPIFDDICSKINNLISKGQT